MKTILLKLSLLLLLLLGIFISCKKSSSDSTNTVTPLTEAQKTAISSSYTQIGATLDPLLQSPDAIHQMSLHLAEIKSMEMVENAFVQDSALVVKFTNAGSVIWYVPTPYTIPPYSKNMPLGPSANRIPVGNKQALLVNVQSNDESRPYNGQIINDLDQEFTDNGYTTTVVNAPGAPMSFFAGSMGGYGAVFLITHGGLIGSRTFLATGQSPLDPSNPLAQLLNELYSKWSTDLVFLASLKEKRAGSWVSTKYYCVSEKFIAASYSAGSFPNTLFYTVACEALKGSNQLADAFTNAGVGVFIGWDETNCAGQGTGKLLFDLLLGGFTVGDAFDVMPADSKLDQHGNDPLKHKPANLKYYPAGGKDYCLVAEQHAWVVIENPVAGQSYSERVLTLSGYVDSVETLTGGIVEVNGVATTLKITDRKNFSQSIVINNGPNSIKVTAKGKRANGLNVAGVKEIGITGTLANIDIFTELRWNTDNTDIDFHMLPPGSSISDLWTNADCYYSNKSTSWGGFLDVDNTAGYGPEHISVPSVSTPGIYRLFIHFYRDHGGGATQAFADVSTMNGTNHKFGPYTLTKDGGDNAGDVWEVCTITFPGGIITPVNKYYNLGKKYQNINLPAKGK
ncbi:MAG: hypothetical protein WCO02_12890 [Bacteroidota bacterium]